MTTVVTGASGHVGGMLVRALLEQGETVRAVVHEGEEGLRGLDVERVRADVRDPESLAKAFAGAKVLFHCAALISIVGDPDGRVQATNVDGAGNAARAALEAGIEKMVHMSSVHAFDLTYMDGPLNEESPRANKDHNGAYDCSKYAGEGRVRDVIKDGLDATIVNPSGVIGLGDYKVSRMGTVFRQLRARKLPSLVPGGFDFVDVRDVVQGAIAARDKGRTGENYLLSGKFHDVRDIASMIETVTGSRPPRFTTPMWLARAGAPFMTGIAKLTRTEPLYTAESLAALRANRNVESTKAERELGYTKTPLRKTVVDFYDWLDNEGSSD